MSSTAGRRPAPRPAARSGSGRGEAATSWFAAVRDTLDRPLTSYHLVLGVGALLLALGLVMVQSASSVASFMSEGSSWFVFRKQLTWVAIGLPLAFVASRMPLRLVRLTAYPALLLSVVLLALTFVPGLGVEINGNRNWLAFGRVQVQPSEVAKLAVVLWAADLFARKDVLLHQTKHLMVPMLPVAGGVALLVVGQRDLGTALVLFAIITGMLWVAGLSTRVFATFVAALVAVVTFFAASDQVRVKRLTGFRDPFADLHDGGWQAAHGLMGLASGQFWGVGLGASRQKWGTLPEAHTDFIFAVIGEELGLFGTLVVLGLFVLLAYTGFRIARRATEPFIRHAAAGITVWLLVQALINLGMVLGVLPVIGIPLPLISYGGSALVPTLVAIGLLVGFARREPGATAALEAAKRRRNTPARRPA